MPRLSSLLVLLLVGCGVRHPSVDASVDAGSVSDAGLSDAGAPDASVPTPAFEDVTAASGIALDRTPAEGWNTFADRISGGVCVLDVDGGAPDLFFAVRPSGAQRSRLFVANEPMSYVDETDARGLGDVGDAIGCLVLDVDGDDTDDLLVTGVGGVRLFLSRDGVFVDASDRLGAAFGADVVYASAAAGDVDGDRDLDLVIAGYLRRDPAIAAMTDCVPTPCAAEITIHEGASNHLLVQEPGGDFVERTAALAPDLAALEATLVVAVGDFVHRGTTQIYVGNDLGSFHQNRLLSFEAGRWVDIGWDVGMHASWRGYGIDSMGLSSADIDRDGELEHVVTTFERRMTSVFDCERGVGCEDRARNVGMELTDTTFRWGPALVDLDLDGYPDLVEATGHYFDGPEIEHFDFLGERDQPMNVLRNDGRGIFVLDAPRPGDGSRVPRSARGIAVTDLDDDGRPDIVLATALGPPALLRNTHVRRGGWLAVRLDGRAPNTRAIGARVRLREELGEPGIVREVRAGEGYLGSFDRRLFFGVGRARRVFVDVEWPDGEVSGPMLVSVDTELVIAR